jgi:hypothetical protein
MGVSERRKYARLSIKVPVAPKVDLVDLSEGGAQLEVRWAVPIGSLVSLQLDGVHPALRHSVAYHVLAVRPSSAKGRFRVHGRFLQGPCSVQRDLRAIIREAHSSPPDRLIHAQDRTERSR